MSPNATIQHYLMLNVLQGEQYCPLYAKATACVDKMGRGKSLTEAETAKVQTLSEEGYKPAEIARRVRRSRNAVVHVLNSRKANICSPRIGRPRKISPKHVRAMLRKARSGNYTHTKLRGMFRADVSVLRVQQLLHQDHRLSWKRM